MKLKDYVKIIFKNDNGEKAELEITVKQLLDKTTDDILDLLCDSDTCTSASCNNESQNFCDCGSIYEDYKIVEVIPLT